MHFFKAYNEDEHKVETIVTYSDFKDANGIMDNPDVIGPYENTVTFVESDFHKMSRDDRTKAWWSGLDLGAAIVALGGFGVSIGISLVKHFKTRKHK